MWSAAAVPESAAAPAEAEAAPAEAGGGVGRGCGRSGGKGCTLLGSCGRDADGSLGCALLSCGLKGGCDDTGSRYQGFISVVMSFAFVLAGSS